MYRFNRLFPPIYLQSAFSNRIVIKHRNNARIEFKCRFFANQSAKPPNFPNADNQKPNLMSRLPTPSGSWEEEYNKRHRKYQRKFIAGLLAFGISLIALYNTVNFTKPITPTVEKKAKKKVLGIRPNRKIIRTPENGNEIPEDVPYLLIGGGTASFSAFRAIKSADPLAKVLVISDEEHYPYMRPPLSKEIWFNDDRTAMHKLKFRQWNGTERSLFYEPDDFYVNCNELMDAQNGGVAVARGWTVEKVDPKKRLAYLEGGKKIRYQKCLIATGAQPKNLAILDKAESEVHRKVTLYRGIPDFADLEYVCNNGGSVAIVGGGFLGSELSCALARYGKNKNLTVYQLFRENGCMEKVLPEYLSQWTSEKIKAEGVNMLKNSQINAIELKGSGKLSISLNNGNSLEVDHLVVAVGVEPNTKLAKASKLEIDPEYGGILVNSELEIRSNLYAAGDCACFYDTKLGRRRVEHHDHAVVSGRLAGENMTGAENPYVHQSMFWSDLGPDIGYEAIGIIDSRLPTVAVFAQTIPDAPTKPSKSESGESDGETNTADSSPPSTAPPPPAGDAAPDDGDPCECPDPPTSLLTPTDHVLDVNETNSSPADQKTCVEDTAPGKYENGEGADYSKGVIFYLKDEIVVGIVLWNVFSRMTVARQVIKEHRKFDDLNELAKLFNIHEE